MTLENRLKLSYYKEIGEISHEQGVKLVQHIETKRVFVLKSPTIYDLRVFQFLKDNPIDGIPQIEELIEDDGKLIIIEEYISGDSLRQVLDQHGPLSEKATINLVFQLCDILIPLHKLNPPIVHRDIKPGNLILTSDFRLILVDFNAAKQVYSSNHQKRDTVLIGTAGYAAPEQYGFSLSMPTADIYAIGVLMNELLTGELPSQKRYCGRLERIIDCCLEIDPANRYRSLDELKQSLLALEKHHRSFDLTASQRSWLPPGYRTLNPIKMILATLMYLSFAGLSFCLSVNGGNGIMLFLCRLLCFTIFVADAFWVGNYRNVWSKMPLTNSPHFTQRMLGVVIWGVALTSSLFFIGVFTIAMLFP